MAARSLHEAGLARRGVRKGLGAYYTPPDVVAGLLDLSLEPLLAERSARGADAVASLRLVDPACGTGNFLHAALQRIARALEHLGVPAAEAHERASMCLLGIEVDPATAAACRSALPGVRVITGDALLEPSTATEGSFDLVIGNPPFLSQLGAETARSAEVSDALRRRFGDGVGTYTDPAALFLLLGHSLARPDGGVVAMIEPMSMLTARDAGSVRRRVLGGARLTDLWVIGEGVFDAAVEVCAPVIARGSTAAATQLHTGRERMRGATVPAPSTTGSSWSSLLAEHRGLPTRSLSVAGTLADLASATADFRDQYYGLAPHVVDQVDADDVEFPPLVTSGLIDPAMLRWGARTTRFNKVTYSHPRVDRSALPGALGRWADARLVPKVLLATQTRVPEAVVDATGRLLPSVPVISIVAIGPDPLDLWRIGAVLSCPAIALEVARRHLGSGRNARAVRMRAQEVVALPAPADGKRWLQAARSLEGGASLAQVGRTMDEAYGLIDDEELLAWWRALLPGVR